MNKYQQSQKIISALRKIITQNAFKTADEAMASLANALQNYRFSGYDAADTIIVAFSDAANTTISIKSTIYPKLDRDIEWIKKIHYSELISFEQERELNYKMVGGKNLYAAAFVGGKVYKSYNTVIAIKKHGKIYLKNDARDYSVTTSRHIGLILSDKFATLEENVVF